MGNNRFRLSDMIPNSWFYKLKDMGRTRNQTMNPPTNKKQPLIPPPPPSPSSSSSSSTSPSPPPPLSISIPHQQQSQSKTEQPPNLFSYQRKSYYFTRQLTPPKSQTTDTNFPDPPRKSSKQRLTPTTRRRNRASNRQLPPVTAANSVACICHATINSVWEKPDSISEEYPVSPLDSSSDLQSLFPEFGSNRDHESPEFDGFDPISKLELRPILTKTPIKNLSVGEKEKIRLRKEQRKSPVRSPGVRIRLNSPRIARIGVAHGRKSVSSSSRRKSLSESFAVVKSSADPQRDFRESMVEMIVENNLKASKDLEDLLACYLQLNSDEYHEVIIEVFKQIWFDLAHVRFK